MTDVSGSVVGTVVYEDGNPLPSSRESTGNGSTQQENRECCRKLIVLLETSSTSSENEHTSHGRPANKLFRPTWQYGQLVGYRSYKGKDYVLVPWLDTWEDAHLFPSEDVSQVSSNGYRDRKRKRSPTYIPFRTREGCDFGEREWPYLALLDHRIEAGSREVLVQWEPTWEDADGYPGVLIKEAKRRRLKYQPKKQHRKRISSRG